MHKLTEVPIPAATHFVGMVYGYEKEGVRSVMAVKGNSMHKEGHIKVKFPGGSSEKLYEEHFHFENALFDKLKALGFEKKAQAKIYRNELKRKELLEGYGDHKTMAYVLRTLVLEVLDEVGYYPMDMEPEVIYFDQKSVHIQYFVVVEKLLDAKGEIIEIPEQTPGFRPLDINLVETRVSLDVNEALTFSHSHKVAAKKYFLKYGLTADIPEEEEEV